MIWTHPDSIACAVRIALPMIARPDVCGQPVVAVVRHPDRVRFVFPGDRHHHGAEDLLARNPPIVPDVGEHRRLDEVALRKRSVLGGKSAEHATSARLPQPVVDVAADAVELLPADDGPHVGGFVERIADPEGGQLVGELGEEGLEDRAVEEQARSGGARLALTRHAHSCNHAVHRAVVVGIRKDDGGALAAKLQ